MNARALPPRERIALSSFIPARLARPPFSAWQEGGPERLALAGRPVSPVSLVLALSAAVLQSRRAGRSSSDSGPEILPKAGCTSNELVLE